MSRSEHHARIRVSMTGFHPSLDLLSRLTHSQHRSLYLRLGNVQASGWRLFVQTFSAVLDSTRNCPTLRYFLPLKLFRPTIKNSSWSSLTHSVRLPLTHITCLGVQGSFHWIGIERSKQSIIIHLDSDMNLFTTSI